MPTRSESNDTGKQVSGCVRFTQPSITEKQEQRRGVLGAHFNYPHMLDILIGKLPDPERIAYRKLRSICDYDLTNEKREFFSEGELTGACIVWPEDKLKHHSPFVYPWENLHARHSRFPL